MSREVVTTHETSLVEKLEKLEADLEKQEGHSQEYWDEHTVLSEKATAAEEANDKNRYQYREDSRSKMDSWVSSSRRERKLERQIQDIRSELTEIHLTKEGNTTLGKIETVISQGSTQNWIMLVIALFMAVMAWFTYQNSRPVEVIEPVQEEQGIEEGENVPPVPAD